MYVDGRALPYLNILVLMGFYLIHTLHFHKCHPMFSVEMDLRTDDCANRVLVSVTCQSISRNRSLTRSCFQQVAPYLRREKPVQLPKRQFGRSVALP
jgi:hypothetical protein